MGRDNNSREGGGSQDYVGLNTEDSPAKMKKLLAHDPSF